MYRLFIALVFLAAEIAAPRAGELRSGYQDASPQTQGMQDDDTVNPGFLWVETGKALWSEPAGGAFAMLVDCNRSFPVAHSLAASSPGSRMATV